jgi:Uma2 family endonuclease
VGAIESYVRTHRLGVALGAPFDVILRRQDPAVVVQPDFLFVARAHMDRMQESGLFGPPDLVVEVVSPSNARHDSIKKRQLYADHGVQEYWLVLPEVEQVEVLRREGGPGFGRPTVVEAGDVLTTPLLPGFELAVADLFEPEA